MEIIDCPLRPYIMMVSVKIRYINTQIRNGDHQQNRSPSNVTKRNRSNLSRFLHEMIPTMFRKKKSQ